MKKTFSAFTMADRRSSRTHTLGFGNAFTMAEILISLTIIGVIAALTLPALMANLNEKVWNTQRKALHSRMAQALAAMPRLDGYHETTDGTEGYNFILNGLSTALNITKVCEEDRMDKCDFSYPTFSITDDNIGDLPVFRAVPSLITVNGESIGVAYNSTCTGSSNADFLTTNNAENMICANFVYDLNGASKGPNKLGKDMGFITAYFPEYPIVVAPMPMAATTGEIGADSVESYLSDNLDYRLPSPAEVVALSFNGIFIGENYNESAVWSDNDINCNWESCVNGKDKGRNAHVILVSKNGDGPRTFTALESDAIAFPGGDIGISVEACKGDPPDPRHCTCDSSTGKWACDQR